MRRDERAQPETLGTVLLVGIVVLSISVFGVFYLGTVAGGGGPVVDLGVAAQNSTSAPNLTVTHAGGDALSTADVTVVVVRASGDERRIPLRDGSLSGMDPDSFTPGERWTYDGVAFDDRERARVLVVHRPSDALLYDGERCVRPAGARRC